jgi:hypothetical protein
MVAVEHSWNCRQLMLLLSLLLLLLLLLLLPSSSSSSSMTNHESQTLSVSMRNDEHTTRNLNHPTTTTNVYTVQITANNADFFFSYLPDRATNIDMHNINVSRCASEHSHNTCANTLAMSPALYKRQQISTNDV